MTPENPSDALKRAVEHCGGQTALGRKISVKQGLIWYWLNKSGQCPAEYAIPIESATDGAVKRHDLRPDLYPKPEEAAA